MTSQEYAISEARYAVVPHELRLFFGVKVRVRISFRVRVLGNSDHCVLKFNSVFRY